MLMKQQKYYEREKMDWAEKKSISAKSDDKCCHCGNCAFFGHPDHVDRVATVEHVIPISKGGSNHHLNLVMLCEDCNKEKGNKIMPIGWYPYLKEEYKPDLNEYITSWLQVTETERTHVLQYDEYLVPLVQKQFYGYRGHHKKSVFTVNVKVKRANWDDSEKMTEYLIKYLTKNGELGTEEAAAMNIAFWLTFGSIYYVEKNNEIICMTALTMKHVLERESFHGMDVIPYMYMFPYYSNDASVLMTYDIITTLSKYICKENNLDVLPISALMLKADKLTSKFGAWMKGYSADISGFQEFLFTTLTDKKVELNDDAMTVEDMTAAEKKTYAFLSQFKDTNDHILDFLLKYSDSDDIAWMTNCLISYPLLKGTELGECLKNAGFVGL